MSPKDICKSMDRTRRWLYFFRNNPKFRTRYYHEFIAWVGYDKWQDVKPEVRNSWESARNSFDKLHGLSKALKNLKTPEEILIQMQSNSNQSFFDAMENAADILLKVLKLESTIPDANKPEGVKCLKKLIELYTNDIETPAKPIVSQYFDEMAIRYKEVRRLNDAKTKAEIVKISKETK